MDSTCKNLLELNFHSTHIYLKGKLGYELYAVVGEANGQALPLAFAFMCSTNCTVAAGTKDCTCFIMLMSTASDCSNTP